MAMLTEVILVRVTPGMRARIEAEAARLCVRSTDVTRMLLARGLAIDGAPIGNYAKLADGRQGESHAEREG
jgi:hypothetical protein